MKIIFSLCFLFILTICHLKAQNTWQSGFIIKLDSDTIFGQIEVNNSRSNSKQCHFRENETSISKYYTPNELFGYKFSNGRFYISKSVKEINNNEPVFLEYLIKGIVSIYHYGYDERIYFIEKDNKIYELKNTEFNSEKNSTQYLLNKNEYISTLCYLLRDANFSNIIYQSKLTSKSLINLAEKYHNKVCSDQQCIIYEKNNTPINIIFGIYSGVSINKINFGNISESGFSPNYFVATRFEIENLLNWEERITFSIDLLFERLTNYTLKERSNTTTSTITYNDTYYYLTNKNYFVGTNQKNSIDVNIKSNILKLPIAINYYFSKGKTKPYIGTGIITMFILSQSNNFIYHKFDDEFNKSIPTFNIGYLGKFGMKIKLKNKNDIFSEWCYQKTTSTNINEFLRFRQSDFSLNVGYTF